MKIKWSAIGITMASGKSGGTVFSNNRGGAYARRWAKPVNAQSARQTAMRSLFGAVAQTWGTLTESEVSAWKQEAAQISVTDGFGNSHDMTGNTYFMRANQNRTHGMGLPITRVPLALVVLPSIGFTEKVIDMRSTAPAESVVIVNLTNGTPGTAITASIGFAIVAPGSNKGFGSVKNKFADRIRRSVNLDSSGNATVRLTNQDLELRNILSEASNDSTVFIQVHTHSQAGQKSNPVSYVAKLRNDAAYQVVSSVNPGNTVEGGDSLQYTVYRDGILVDPASILVNSTPASYIGAPSVEDDTVKVVVEDDQEAGNFTVRISNSDNPNIYSAELLYQPL